MKVEAKLSLSKIIRYRGETEIQLQSFLSLAILRDGTVSGERLVGKTMSNPRVEEKPF